MKKQNCSHFEVLMGSKTLQNKNHCESANLHQDSSLSGQYSLLREYLVCIHFVFIRTKFYENSFKTTQKKWHLLDRSQKLLKI